MNNIDSTILSLVATAQRQIKHNELGFGDPLTFWVRAFNKAEGKLYNVKHTFDGNVLAIESSDGTRIYLTTRKTCQCAAYVEPVKVGAKPRVCFHRAAFTLLKKYNEVLAIAKSI